MPLSVMETRAKVQVENVRHSLVDPRTRGSVEAIANAETAIAEGEFVSIVGPSGCGKTTLLNMIAGLIHPTEGQIKIDGTPLNGLHPADIGYMFARDTLLPWRTVAGNVELALEFHREPQRRERALEQIRLVGLEGFERHYPDQLSQGMRQRVALARTLLRDPGLLLMDEPFGALDAQTRLLMQGEFLHLWEARQITVVFVTHDLVEAIALSDRVLVFSARPGRIKAEYKVDLPRPRVVDELQGDSRFQALYERIWQDLKVEAKEADELGRLAELRAKHPSSTRA